MSDSTLTAPARLVLAGGQFFSDPGSTKGTQRLFTTMQSRVLFSSAFPASPEEALPHPSSRLSPPKAVPSAVPPPMARVMSWASPPDAAVAVPVASPPPMAIVVSWTSDPPVAQPVAEPPPMAMVRLGVDPVVPAEALQWGPMAIV